MSGEAYKFTVGAFACYALKDGGREVDLKDIFPSIPTEKLSEAIRKADYGGETIMQGYNLLLIDTGEQRILVDAGLGNGSLLDSLKLAGFSPDDIDRVIITHADGDHIGGLLTDAAPTFPNARISYWDTAWDRWTNHLDAVVEELSGVFGPMLGDQLEGMLVARRQYGQEVLPSLADRVDQVAAEAEIVPGIRLIDARGHRGDHAAVEVSSEGQTLIHVVDSLRHPIQVANPTWPSLYDSYPEKLPEINQMLITRIRTLKALVFGAHFTFPGVVNIGEDDRFIPHSNSD